MMEKRCLHCEFQAHPDEAIYQGYCCLSCWFAAHYGNPAEHGLAAHGPCCRGGFTKHEGYFPTKVNKELEDQWKFRGSNGSMNVFGLHVPCVNPQEESSLDALMTPGPRRKRLPLLIYLCGKGGGTYFEDTTKKSWQNPVYRASHEFCAKKFVVVSPQCAGTWRDEPEKWIDELIDVMCTFPRINRRQVYLMGYSMGGMAALSLMSRNLVAACVSAAAYRPTAYDEKAHFIGDRGQKKSYKGWTDVASRIAENIKEGAALRCYHGKKDERCCPDDISEFWAQIERELPDGNTGLETFMVEEGTHESLYEEIFWGKPVYEWLLQQHLPSQSQAELVRRTKMRRGSERMSRSYGVGG
mmetsp:Transcript_46765/g.111221  ORF Transcript_46765/g.111221 Transcript_46765/m.111221 type:complete len:355 (+) Transcript_46765:41-1105(+)